MKLLHRKDLFCWSQFDEERNVDFNSVLWVRPGGNVLIDPLPLTTHDEAQLQSLGGTQWVVITNSDHIRDSRAIAERTQAKVAAPARERNTFPILCDRWLTDGDEVAPGLFALEMHGSKTHGELVLLLEQTTLITGDLIRAHRAGSLNLLPESKLMDPASTQASLDRLVSLKEIDAVLVGDGWSVFRDGALRLKELAERSAAKVGTKKQVQGIPTSC